MTSRTRSRWPLALSIAICALALPAVTSAHSAAHTANCAMVTAAGHKYLVTTSGGYSCAAADSQVSKLAAERPKGNASALSVGKLTGGPAGFNCGASGSSPQRIGRCFKGTTSFTWIKAS